MAKLRSGRKFYVPRAGLEVVAGSEASATGWHTAGAFLPFAAPTRLILLLVVGRGHPQPGVSSGCTCSAVSTSERGRKTGFLLGGGFLPFGCQLLPARPSPPAAPRSQQGWGMAPGAAPQKCHRILLPASHTRGCPRSSLLPVTEAKVVVDRVGGGIRNNRCMGSDCCFCPSSASSFRWSGDVWQGIYLRVWLFCISALVIKSQAA